MADEARRLHDTWAHQTAADHWPGASASRLIPPIIGIALGLLLGTLLNLLMLPLGEPGAAEIPFALGMLIDAVALFVAVIAALLRRPGLVGFSIGIIGGWVVVWFVPSYCFECRVLLSRLGVY